LNAEYRGKRNKQSQCNSMQSIEEKEKMQGWECLISSAFQTVTSDLN
jgi:hypothetical protein